MTQAGAIARTVYVTEPEFAFLYVHSLCPFWEAWVRNGVFQSEKIEKEEPQ